MPAVPERMGDGVPLEIALTGSRFRGMALRFAAAQTAVLLLFGPYVANVSTHEYRYRNMWQTRDALFVIGCMAGAAAAAVVVEGLIRLMRRPRLVAVFDHLFVLALGAGVLANLWFCSSRPEGYSIGKLGMETRTLWLLLFGLVGYSLANPGFRLVERCKQFCLIVWPAVILVGIHILCLGTYPSPSDPFPQERTRSTAASIRPARDRMRLQATVSVVSDPSNGAGLAAACPPVYVFVFDGWSYDRTFDNDRVRPDLVNLSRLLKQSTAFRDAHSPGDCTEASMPRLLFQTDKKAVVRSDGVGFDDAGQYIPARRLRSIYSAVDGRGYDTFLVGYSLPYRTWLGPEVGTCRNYRWFESGHDARGKLSVLAYGVIRYWTDPWTSWFYHRRIEKARDEWTLQIHQELKRDVMQLVDRDGMGSFAIIHYPLPHYPYFLGETYGDASPCRLSWVSEDLHGYERNLVHMDGLIGEVIDAMRRSGQWDEAMVVLTSDHAWRDDPDRQTRSASSDLTHVPLIVKFPNQHEGGVFSTRFETRRLKVLVEHALTTAGEIDDLDKLVASAMSVEGSRTGRCGLARAGRVGE